MTTSQQQSAGNSETPPPPRMTDKKENESRLLLTAAFPHNNVCAAGQYVWYAGQAVVCSDCSGRLRRARGAEHCTVIGAVLE